MAVIGPNLTPRVMKGMTRFPDFSRASIRAGCLPPTWLFKVGWPKNYCLWKEFLGWLLRNCEDRFRLAIAWGIGWCWYEWMEVDAAGMILLVGFPQAIPLFSRLEIINLHIMHLGIFLLTCKSFFSLTCS